MSDPLTRFLYRAASRTGLSPWRLEAVRPVPGLAAVADGLTPGRAVDLGCGDGRNTLYLAARGWEAVGVDLAQPAIEIARRKAADRAIAAHFLVGDVTRLEQLGLGHGYTLLLDAGCYYGIAAAQRDAYAAGVTALAAPGALLLLLGFTWPGVPGRGVSAAELRRRLRGWDLLEAAPVPGPEMRAYYGGPPLPRALIGRGWLAIERYLLRRTERGA